MVNYRARAGRREWIGLAVLVLPTLLVSMDMTALFFALPSLSADLQPSSAQQLWIMDIYAFLLAGSMITMGALGDRIGRRKVLLIGACLFGVTSVLAAYAGTAELLIAARALLGVAGATLAPSTLSLIRNMFHDAQQRRTAIAVWTAGFSGGAGLGPMLGGLLLEKFWWGSVFLVNVPVMLILLCLGPLLLPEYRDPKAGRFDLFSAFLSLAAVLPVIYGIKMTAEDGAEPLPLGSIAFGLVVGYLFLRRQRRLADPLIDVRLFANRGFSTSIGANVLSIFAMVGFGFFGTQFMQLVLGMRPLEAALWTLIIAPSIGLSVILASTMVRWVRPAYVVAGAIALMGVGFVILSQVQVDSSMAVLGLGFIILTGGAGAVGALAVDMIVAAAPPERAGAASALSETGSEFGGALGVAILGSIGAAVYHNRMDDAVPQGLPPEAAEAATDTLGGATDVSRHLPEQIGAPLIETAQEAFAAGMRVSALTGAAVMAVTAVIAAITLRHLNPAGAAEDAVEDASPPRTPELVDEP
ncbi:MFS transporter [Spirillospora sp. CA-255316]